jgi:hypothetical protein
MKFKLMLFVAFAFLTVSCTPVRFYSDPQLTRKTGIRFYSVKPFLLAERDPESGRIIKSSVICLPDLTNPQYMEIKNAPGASKTDLKLDEGILTSFGLDYEQMIPETIESISSLISKTAGAAEDLKLKAPVSSPNTVVLFEIIMTPQGTFLKEIQTKN